MSYRDFTPGIRYAITWLHARAEEMNDPKAKQILNSAAFSLGVEHARKHMSPRVSRFGEPAGNFVNGPETLVNVVGDDGLEPPTSSV